MSAVVAPANVHDAKPLEEPLTGHTCLVLDMAVDAAGVAVGMIAGWVLGSLGRLL